MIQVEAGQAPKQLPSLDGGTPNFLGFGQSLLSNPGQPDLKQGHGRTLPVRDTATNTAGSQVGQRDTSRRLVCDEARGAALLWERHWRLGKVNVFPGPRMASEGPGLGSGGPAAWQAKQLRCLRVAGQPLGVLCHQGPLRGLQGPAGYHSSESSSRCCPGLACQPWRIGAVCSS